MIVLNVAAVGSIGGIELRSRVSVLVVALGAVIVVFFVCADVETPRVSASVRIVVPPAVCVGDGCVVDGVVAVVITN